ncbi:threonine-phosphate decarboxylase [Marinobacter sp. NP-4(2019)]|uniref:threonine-phosphate decarboxylase CobD n=1 Tax=Marinobacter sp. NP-4(2019) TaxID=2488665 RepID=UPI000FC3CD33|nr:threonine-phosphate decarboxylase CobD [Marinobacter sp. NP-4(2019)]AZT82349.1 threonine-phosphate decarboxylase [Marinobacter sp. NP-4(2019)]
MTAPEHGGRLNAAAKRWGIPRDQWLDLSTGINPNGWPVPDMPPEVWQRLPEPDDDLEALVRQWAGAPADAACVPVAGSQEAIMALPRLRVSCRVGVPSPGYREHGHSWSCAGHRVVSLDGAQVTGEDESWLDNLDVLVWINPNNPTGETIEPDRLLRWHQRLQHRGGWLIVDEAFVDGRPELSLGFATGREGLVVLRSLGKFFGLAGVRAGAVLTGPALAERLRNSIGPWTVSGPARYVMGLALADDHWQAATAERLLADSQRLERLLAAHGLNGSGGSLLFRYFQHPRSAELADALARQGILVRQFDQPPALRFGLPGSETEWERLSQALIACRMSLTNR